MEDARSRVHLRDAARRRRSRRRTIGWGIAGALLVLIVVGIGAIGWIFSNDILVPQPYTLQSEFTIVDTDPGSVTLPLPPNDRQFADTRQEGRFALIWEGGAGLLGPVRSEDETSLVRDLESLWGAPPTPGAEARLDAYLYRGLDPERAHDLAFEDVTLAGDIGDLHAWWLPAERETAVLMLHGRRRADLSETLRMLPTLVEQGYPVLALAYRNHDRSAMSPDGFYHYGQTEWNDVVTGLDFLYDRGVERVVVYAYSFGSAVTLETIEALNADPARSEVEVAGLVLDSPFLDPREVFRQGARNRNLPLAGPIADLATWVARLRSGIRWSELDQRRSASAFTLPLLLIHGTDDGTIPVGLSDTFATDYGGPIDYLRIDGADHTEGWNIDTTTYVDRVRAFLDLIAPPSAP
jgi:pimeloyl-ACP methyl ester carboxylesterase